MSETGDESNVENSRPFFFLDHYTMSSDLLNLIKNAKAFHLRV